MSRSTVIKCDVCRSVIEGHHVPNELTSSELIVHPFPIDGNGERKYDLCSTCTNALEQIINTQRELVQQKKMTTWP